MIDFISKIFSIIIILILIWIWYMNHNHPICEEIWIDDVMRYAKTGDLILFKALDNYNSSKIFNYYTHIGIVYVNGHEKLIFEANSPEGLELYDFENKNGIYLSNLHTRLTRYKGMIYYKPLNKGVDQNLLPGFNEFIQYALSNMYYDKSVIWNGIKKYTGIEKMHQGTNCGEITLLSLIKLGIIDPNKYNLRALHHLRWMCNLKDCDYGYYYENSYKIKLSPFI